MLPFFDYLPTYHSMDSFYPKSGQKQESFGLPTHLILSISESVIFSVISCLKNYGMENFPGLPEYDAKHWANVVIECTLMYRN